MGWGYIKLEGELSSLKKFTNQNAVSVKKEAEDKSFLVCFTYCTIVEEGGFWPSKTELTVALFPIEAPFVKWAKWNWGKIQKFYDMYYQS